MLYHGMKFLNLVLILFAISFFVPTVNSVAASLEETFAQAQAAFKAGDNEKAALLFSQTADMLQKAKKVDQARAILANAGICYMKAEKYEDAANIYEGVIAMKGAATPEALQKWYNNLVVCRTNLGQNALRAQALEKMLKALPKLNNIEKADIYARMADAYKSLELYNKAQQAYKMAFDMLPPNAKPEQRAMILAGMGMCLGNIGDFDGAEKSLTMAKQQADTLNIPITKAESDSNLGVLFWERGDYQKAIDLIKSALNIEVQNKLRKSEGRDNNNIGLVFKSSGKLSDAMKHFEISIAIADETNDKSFKGVALQNRALLYRMTGNLNDARNDYKTALKIFDENGYQRGKAYATMGVARIAELEDRDLNTALKGYQEALDTFKRLELAYPQGAALIYIGGVLKRTITPGKSTRDLTFDDEPPTPKISKADALKQCKDAYTKALAIGDAMKSKEIQWQATAGLGFCLEQEGKLPEAFEKYQKAIDIVTAMRISLESAEMLGEFMADKEDLFSEATALCGKLYEKTKDQKYIILQLSYSETMRNEIQKASAAIAQLNFDNPKQQALYSQIMEKGASLAKAQSAITVIPPEKEKTKTSQEQKAFDTDAKQNNAEQAAKLVKLEAEYSELIKKWGNEYPDDKQVFNSRSDIDANSLQKALGENEVALQYIQTPSRLFLVAISNKGIHYGELFDVKGVLPDDNGQPGKQGQSVGRKALDNYIKKKFIVGYLEGYGRKYSYPGLEINKALEEFKSVNEILSTLYSILIPVEIQNKLGADIKRIYYIADGFLAQIPMTALVTNGDTANPQYLIEKCNISNTRPLFLAEAVAKRQNKNPINSLLGVGNPRNTKVICLTNLPGAEVEITNAKKIIEANNPKGVHTNTKYSASSKWLTESLKNSSYDMIYFATHGVPYSEVYLTYILKEEKAKQMNFNAIKEDPESYPEGRGKSDDEIKESIENEYKLIKVTLGEKFQPLNGYLYMADDGTDSRDSGLLTISRISGLSTSNGDNPFKNTRQVILSACNTGVTLVPKVLKYAGAEIESDSKKDAKEAETMLTKAGWRPGVEQISFVDIFMKKGVSNVYGTLWFVDDNSSNLILTNYITLLMKNPDDAVKAYSDTLVNYINDCRNKKITLDGGGKKYNFPLHPFFWAAGAIFGK